jgi:hypothetical protein
VQAIFAAGQGNLIEMSADEFSNRVSKLEQLLSGNMPGINEALALDCAGMVKDRLVNDGKKADGSSLGKYSENEIPLFFYKNGKLQAPFSHPLNQGGESLFLKVQKNNKLKKNGGKREEGGPLKGISYREWRDANNRPTDHVNLKFTGQTMRDIGPVRQTISGSRYTTSVGAKNTVFRKAGATTDKVLEGWGDKYGNVLEPNQEELVRLKKILEDQIKKLIDDSFNS